MRKARGLPMSSLSKRVGSAAVLLAANCSASTLARWVSLGLVPPCTRVGSHTGGVQGFYPAEAVEIVKEIVALRKGGMTLAEIKKQLDEKAKGAAPRKVKR
jgi:DNA-binding transcriptional MerR regulator